METMTDHSLWVPERWLLGATIRVLCLCLGFQLCKNSDDVLSLIPPNLQGGSRYSTMLSTVCPDSLIPQIHSLCKQSLPTVGQEMGTLQQTRESSCLPSVYFSLEVEYFSAECVSVTPRQHTLVSEGECTPFRVKQCKQKPWTFLHNDIGFVSSAPPILPTSTSALPSHSNLSVGAVRASFFGIMPSAMKNSILAFKSIALKCEFPRHSPWDDRDTYVMRKGSQKRVFYHVSF